MQKEINVLFVGLGSIGTRHFNNLRTLCGKLGLSVRIDALRSDLARPLREGVREHITAEFTELNAENALQEYDIAFITNPTAYHAQVLQTLKGRVGTFFIEKPIFDDTQIDIALDTVLAPNQKAYIAAPMRWCGAMLALKKYLASHPEAKPYCARAICSSYLPDWRPGVDYRTVYSAHRDLGGGVTIDLIHEWDYLMDLFGKPLEMHHFKGTYSELEIDSDDLSIYIARYRDLLCELHLDYFGREYRRSIELFTKEGTITADFGAGTLTLPDGTVERYEEDVNERYLRELNYFLSYALEKGQQESINPPAEGLSVLRLTLGC